MLKNKKIVIISNFPKNEQSVNGQSLKAQYLIEAFALQGFRVKKVNYSYYKRRPILVFFNFLFSLLWSNVAIILPDKGALSFLAKFCTTPIFKNKKIFYSVVGGWLPEFITNKQKLIKRLQKFNGIWVENNDMKLKLASAGVANAITIENFKIYKNNLEIESYSEFKSKIGKFCFFSRLDPDKGIIETIEAIKKCKENNIDVKLDIYGPIKPSFSDEFGLLISKNNDCVNYCGIGDPATANIIISKYYMQFFITKLKTEGIPGSVIDSFAAGVPLMFVKWNSKFDMIVDEKTGFECPNSNIDNIYKKIKYSVENPELVFKMKSNCFEEFKKYEYTSVFSKILKEISK